ncbi:MAG: bifunctional 4-hydroxy-2-oxoglutarate aldolase/2-dehydro-3-deoxy-phosphogluconate aldolase [Cyanobacteria bacterium P01_E01_bin.43]
MVEIVGWVAVMDRATWLAALRKHRAIAILRATSLETGIQMAQAAVKGGFRLLEVTWTSDRPGDLVNQLRTTLPGDCLVGGGTLLSIPDLQDAIAAGIQFSFMPHTETALMQLGQHHGIPMVPGALTPTEIMAAWQLGAMGVKVFPCQALGGPAYIRHLQGPLAHIPLIPTGGIALTDGRTYLEQGAIAIGVASSLFPQALLRREDWSAIETRSRQFLASLTGTASRPQGH